MHKLWVLNFVTLCLWWRVPNYARTCQASKCVLLPLKRSDSMSMLCSEVARLLCGSRWSCFWSVLLCWCLICMVHTFARAETCQTWPYAEAVPLHGVARAQYLPTVILGNATEMAASHQPLGWTPLKSPWWSFYDATLGSEHLGPDSIGCFAAEDLQTSWGDPTLGWSLGRRFSGNLLVSQNHCIGLLCLLGSFPWLHGCVTFLWAKTAKTEILCPSLRTPGGFIFFLLFRGGTTILTRRAKGADGRHRLNGGEMDDAWSWCNIAIRRRLKM